MFGQLYGSTVEQQIQLGRQWYVVALGILLRCFFFYAHTSITAIGKNISRKNGFRSIAFEKISVLDYFIHR